MKKNLYILLAAIVIAVGVFAYLKLHQALQQSAHAPLSRQEKNAIIEQGIALELPAVSATVSAQANAIDEQATKKVHESHYEEAIALIVAGLKKFPHDFTLQYDLASLLGDCSEITPSPLKERMLEKAKTLFDRLVKDADKQPKDVFYPFMNEYYFRRKMYAEQYELGKQRVADYWDTKEWNAHGVKGFYCQGVGAARYAQLLIEKNKNIKLAREYAQKAVVAFAQYFSYTNEYYNAYVHYALALGILGYEDDMMKALLRSSKIIKKELTYFEFAEIIEFVDKYCASAKT